MKAPFYFLLVTTLLSCSQAAQIGQSEASVLKEHGAPNSALNKGSTRILIYSEGRIKLQQGKVVEVSDALASSDPLTQEGESPKAGTFTKQPSEPDALPAHLKPIVNELVDARHMRMQNPGLEKQRYLLLYFAEGKSQACARVTPQLRHFRERYKSGNNFEVLFVSADSSASQMANHMAKQSMPWPALRYQAIDDSGLRKHQGKLLPAMTLLDATGQVITSSEIDGSYKGCGNVMDALQKQL